MCAKEDVRIATFALIEDYWGMDWVGFVEQMTRLTRGTARVAVMRQATTELTIPTPGQGLHDITAQVTDWVSKARIDRGLLTLFIRHTSASLLITEPSALLTTTE